MITRESVDTNPKTHTPLPPEPPTPQGGRSTWVRLLLAPLLVLSAVAHLVLLFMPLPSRPVAEVEEEAPAEEFVDLLNISSLPASEPELEPTTPLPETAPPPVAATAPTAPTQPIAPTAFPDTPPPAAAPVDTPLAAEPTFDALSEQPAVVMQEEEVTEIFTSLTQGAGESDFDSTDRAFPAIAYLTRGGIGSWLPEERDCFFESISDTDYRLHPNAVSLRYLTRNEQNIRDEDVPRTFQNPQYQVASVPGGFCNRALFQVLRSGQPFLFISVAGVGVGAPGQQAGGIVIIWSNDPRSS